MKIKLEKINLNLLNRDIKKIEKADFARLIEGSFHEWAFPNVTDKIDWSAEFTIECEDKKLKYIVDTSKKYITSLDLDGCLIGDKINLDENIDLLLSAKHSYIYELLIFHEISKLKIVSDDKLKAVELNLFPRWTSGYLSDDLETNKIVKEFIKAVEPLLDEFEIVKKIDINISKITIQGDNKLVLKCFKDFIKEYFKKNIFFIMYDKGYINFLSKIDVNRLILSLKKFNPNLEEVELYT